MSDSLVGGFSYVETRYPRCSPFIAEPQTLCAKHGVALVHKEDSMRIIAESGEEVGKLLLVCDGRMMWSPNL